MVDNHQERISQEQFDACIKQIVETSNTIRDNWQYHQKEGLANDSYLTKECKQLLNNKDSTREHQLLVVFEYHVAYNINYGVPVLCFIAWKQDGSALHLEEYCKFNTKFGKKDIFSTLTQLDHPVLCRPFLTLHPCKTAEIIAPFLKMSKNPVLSWLSIISPYLDLQLEEDYFKNLLIT